MRQLSKYMGDIVTPERTQARRMHPEYYWLSKCRLHWEQEYGIWGLSAGKAHGCRVGGCVNASPGTRKTHDSSHFYIKEKPLTNIYFSYVSVLPAFIRTVCVQYLWMAEGDIRSPGSRVINNCKHQVSAESQSHVLGKSSQCSQPSLQAPLRKNLMKFVIHWLHKIRIPKWHLISVGRPECLISTGKLSGFLSQLLGDLYRVCQLL